MLVLVVKVAVVGEFTCVVINHSLPRGVQMVRKMWHGYQEQIVLRRRGTRGDGRDGRLLSPEEPPLGEMAGC
jgi:hypothetical protein